MNFRQKLSQFMYGRNGIDVLGVFLLVVSVVLMTLSTLFSRISVLSELFLALEWMVLLLCVFRIFSRNTYKFFRCPSCHALLRVPRGKGVLELTCRKCGNRFKRRT